MKILHALVPLAALGMGLAASSRTAGCQEPADSMLVERITPRWSIGSVSFHAGTAHLGLGELNGTLTANARPAFSTDVATVGVSAYARFGRLLLGGSGETALPQRESSPGWRNKISFGSASLDAGIALVERPRLLIASQVSFGIRTTTLRMEQRGDFTYTDGVIDPARGLELSSVSALAGAGMMAELRLSTRSTGVFSIGLRAGFSRPLGSPAARAGESAVSGAPHESAGHFLRLSINKPIGKRREIMSTLSTAMLSLLTQ